MGSSGYPYETFEVEKPLEFANFPTVCTEYHFHYSSGNLPRDSGLLNHRINKTAEAGRNLGRSASPTRCLTPFGC